MTQKPFYITTAIFYPNGSPHVGHAYEAIGADALARYVRFLGRQVRFTTGTDEHGLKIHGAARKQGISPKDFVDALVPEFQEMTRLLNISCDDFIRTTEERHKRAVERMWQLLEKDIYKGTYEGWYSVRDEAFYAKSDITKNEKGEAVSPQGNPVEWTTEESYFFRLSAYEDALLDFYEKNPTFLQPNARRNEVISFIKGGLHDLSISRTSFDWGIKVPHDKEHIVYVWLDALTNYISSLGFASKDESMFEDLWPADVHIIGKDIIRFHGVYWPAFLMAAGLALPKRIFAHGFLMYDGEKMSKSVGNVVSPKGLVETYGCDVVRYFLLRHTPFGEDGVYNDESIRVRFNADLANDLGNLAMRSLSMVAKVGGGLVPTPHDFHEDDKTMLKCVDELGERVSPLMESQEIHKALGVIFACIAQGNKYFAQSAPWALKEEPQRRETVLYTTLEVLRGVGLFLQPFIPDKAQALLDMLGVHKDSRTFEHRGEAGRLVAKNILPPPYALFPRPDMKKEED